MSGKKRLLKKSMTGDKVPEATTDALYFIHSDQLGTPQSMTNMAGATVWNASYDPFGQATVNEDPDGNGNLVSLNVRFPGQYFDQETGLHYNYFRTYDPSTGRYITSDPRGILLDFSDPQRQLAAQMGIRIPDTSHRSTLNHLFNYAGQNPIIYIDPTGEILSLIGRGLNAAFNWCVRNRLGCSMAGGAAAGYNINQKLNAQKECELQCEKDNEKCTKSGDTRKLIACKAKCVQDIWGGTKPKAPWVKRM